MLTLAQRLGDEIRKELSIVLKVPFVTYVHTKIRKSKSVAELDAFMRAITRDLAWATWMRKNTSSMVGLIHAPKLNRVQNAAYNALSNPHNPFGRTRIMKMMMNLNDNNRVPTDKKRRRNNQPNSRA